MPALKVTIPGDYWDVQIYRGRLHLWTMEGSVVTIAWDKLVSGLAASAISPLAVRLGLAQGAALYGHDVGPLRAEPEFREWILPLFDAQARQEFVIDHSNMAEVIVAEQDNPTKELPVDTEIYERQVYSATADGVWKASVGQKTKYPISTRPSKMTDLPAVSVRARRNQLALAATGEGLFQMDIGGGWGRDFQQVSGRHCEKADWVFQSLFASSSLSGGYLVSRYWGPDLTVEARQYGNGYSYEEGPGYGGIYGDTQIRGALQDPEFSWAHSEKIFTAGKRQLTSSRYTQKNIVEGIAGASEGLGMIGIEDVSGRAVGGGAGIFGAVVEFSEGLIVVESDEEQFPVEGPITRWRTYPRSENYENHLHVVLDDRVEVYGFYKDYFVDQRVKRFGIEYRPESSGGPSRRSGWNAGRRRVW